MCFVSISNKSMVFIRCVMHDMQKCIGESLAPITDHVDRFPTIQRNTHTDTHIDHFYYPLKSTKVSGYRPPLFASTTTRITSTSFPSTNSSTHSSSIKQKQFSLKLKSKTNTCMNQPLHCCFSSAPYMDVYLTHSFSSSSFDPSSDENHPHISGCY